MAASLASDERKIAGSDPRHDTQRPHRPLGNSLKQVQQFLPTMSAAIADIVAELERLPSADQEASGLNYIHELAAKSRARRQAMLEATAESLSGAEGLAFEQAITQCSQVDENNW